jgi:hypothetical protein
VSLAVAGATERISLAYMRATDLSLNYATRENIVDGIDQNCDGNDD